MVIAMGFVLADLNVDSYARLLTIVESRAGA